MDEKPKKKINLANYFEQNYENVLAKLIKLLENQENVKIEYEIIK